METCLILSLALVTLYPGAVRGDTVHPEKPLVTAAEGDAVTLRCNYKTSTSANYYLYWYRQHPDQTLQYILLRGTKTVSGVQDTAPFAEQRFSSQASDSDTTLNITALELADTAVYHCALQIIRTGDTDKLIFGSGTRLQVEPKSDPTPPSVLLMKSKATSGKQVKAACLAKDFYPKEVKMNFVNSSVVYEQDDPVLSQNGKYNTIKVVQINDTEDVACSVDHQGKQYSAKAAKPAAEQPMTMPTTFCAPSNSTAAEENPEKVNMLAMTVLGLRVLFAKTIAFNTLMTIKLFVF